MALRPETINAANNIGAQIASLIQGLKAAKEAQKFKALLKSAAQPEQVNFPGAQLPPAQPPGMTTPPMLGQFPGGPGQATTLPTVGMQPPPGTNAYPGMFQQQPSPAGIAPHSGQVLPSFEEFLQKVFRENPAGALGLAGMPGVERFMPKAPSSYSYGQGLRDTMTGEVEVPAIDTSPPVAAKPNLQMVKVKGKDGKVRYVPEDQAGGMEAGELWSPQRPQQANPHYRISRGKDGKWKYFDWNPKTRKYEETDQEAADPTVAKTKLDGLEPTFVDGGNANQDLITDPVTKQKITKNEMYDKYYSDISWEEFLAAIATP